MKMFAHVLILSFAAISLMGCGDSEETSTSTLALSEAEAEALQACVTAIAECRAEAAESDADFRELCGELMACLPERDGANASAADWRAYCEGVAERCAEASDDATCAELRERCERGDREDGETSEPAEPPSAEECMADCTGQGIDEAMCTERCSGL